MATTPLSEQQLQEFRKKLVARREEIVSDLKSVRQETPGRGSPEGEMASAAPTHPADEATDEHGRSVAKQLTQTERDLVFEIDEALRRIDQGTYGLCDEGGEAIEMRRLEARPWSRLCLKHAEQLK